MTVIHWKMGWRWNLPSLLTFSMTIHSTLGQIMKADFLNIESLPLASFSVFEMKQEQTAKISMELRSDMETDKIQQNQRVLDSHRSPPVLQQARLRYYESSFDSFNDTEKTPPTKHVHFSGTLVETQTKPQVSRDITRCRSCKEFTKSELKDGILRKACPCHASKTGSNDEKLRIDSIQPKLVKTTEEIENFESKTELPIYRGIKCDNCALPKLQKCNRKRETQLTLAKACVLETTKCNPVQEYCENYVSRPVCQNLCNCAFELRQVSNQARPFQTMDPLDLLNDAEVEALLGEADGEGDLLGRIANAEPNAEENWLEYDIDGSDEEDDYVAGNPDRFSDYEDTSDSFNGSYGYPTDLRQSPLPRRTPPPRPLSFENPQEFQQFDNLTMMDFRIALPDDGSEMSDCDQELDDLKDQDVPTSH